MPELIEYRQLPARSYPGFHRLSDRLVHHLSESDRVDLTPALAQVLFQAALAKRTLVLGTSERAVLSPFLVSEMRRFGHRWCFRRRDGTICDALSGHVITHWDQLLEPTREGVGSLLRPGTPEQSHAAISVEVVGHHRAREDLLVGAMAEALATCTGGENLDAMGMREPLLQWWNRSVLTEHARGQMPMTDTVRASSPQGAFVSLTYERDEQGVIERMNGRLVLGPWQEWAPRAGTIAESVLAQFTKLCTPIVMTTSLIDVEADGGQGIRLRHAEQPLAWLAGPSTLEDARVDVDTIAARYHGTTLGAPSRPSLMVSFPPSEADPRQQLTRLLADVGLRAADELAADRTDHQQGRRFEEAGVDGVRTWRPKVVE